MRDGRPKNTMHKIKNTMPLPVKINAMIVMINSARMTNNCHTIKYKYPKNTAIVKIIVITHRSIFSVRFDIDPSNIRNKSKKNTQSIKIISPAI